MPITKLSAFRIEVTCNSKASGTATVPPRLLVAARPHDVADRPFDGFVDRHRRFLSLLANHYQVGLLAMRASGDDSPRPYLTNIVTLAEVDVPPPAGSRLGRIARAFSEALGKPVLSDVTIPPEVVKFCPDVALTLGPWLDREYAPVFAAYPTVHLFEEDLNRMIEIAPQSVQARAFRRLEGLLLGLSDRSPLIAAYIGPGERTHTRRYHPKAELLELPFTLDPQQWRLASTQSSGESVLVVGNFKEERNAAGLKLLLAEIQKRHLPGPLPIRIVSGPGLHDCVKPYVGTSSVVHDTTQEPLPDKYQQSFAAVIPAWRVTGLKTTILQAWSCRCPVVSSTQAASTVNAPQALLAATSPKEMVNHLLWLQKDASQRQRLAQAGIAVLKAHYDSKAQEQRLLSALERARLANTPSTLGHSLSQ